VRAARLHVEDEAVVLSPAQGNDEPREIPYDDLVGVEIRPPGDTGGARPAIVLKLRGGDALELESNVDRWIVAQLLERLFAHGLGGTHRILVAARLWPGAGERVRELLHGGPPFPPEATPLVLHEVYLLEDEVLFLFVTEDAAAVETLAEPDFWAAAGAWRELVAGEIRLAERVYAWSREEQPTTGAHHFGLGF
jgi:hypothetical protein